MLDKDFEARLLPLYRQRLDKLHKTVEAYEAAIDTDYIDRMRKRGTALELVAYDLLAAMGVAVIPSEDSVLALQRQGISEARAREMLALLNKKISL